MRKTRERADRLPDDFGLGLRTLREERNLSLRELAERAGVSQVTIWKWEHGYSQPRSRMLPSLAQALQVPVTWLTEPPDGDGVLVAVPKPEAREGIDPPSSGRPEVLADVVAQAKQMIAKAAGNSPDQIVIRLDF
jgi:transcriptional regulator with XRE-family HTH domain